MMKDELKGKTMTEICGNRAKSYTYTVDDYLGKCDKNFCDGSCKEKDCIGNGGKKCKGINKSVVKKELTIENYKECVLGGKGKTLEQVNFRSHKQEMFTERIRKVDLSPYDDKRVVLEDGVRTLPIGHWRTKHPALHNLLVALPREGNLANLALNRDLKIAVYGKRLTSRNSFVIQSKA